MHIMYVDESGDPGLHAYGSSHFILSGLIISQDDWSKYLDRLKAFRKQLKNKYGLNQRTEIHASELIRINGIADYRTITKTNRINILKDYCGQIPLIFNTARIVNICLQKDQFASARDIQEIAWSRLIQRYDTYLKKNAKDLGIIITDDTEGLKVMQLARKMRIYNPVLSHYSGMPYNVPTDNITEDIFQRSSHHSYFIQSVDVVSHLLYRKEFPKGSLRKFNLERQFDRLEPILLKEASKIDPMGVVRK